MGKKKKSAGAGVLNDAEPSAAKSAQASGSLAAGAPGAPGAPAAARVRTKNQAKLAAAAAASSPYSFTLWINSRPWNTFMDFPEQVDARAWQISDALVFFVCLATLLVHLTMGVNDFNWMVSAACWDLFARTLGGTIPLSPFSAFAILVLCGFASSRRPKMTPSAPFKISAFLLFVLSLITVLYMSSVDDPQRRIATVQPVLGLLVFLTFVNAVCSAGVGRFFHKYVL
eukprot:tig00001525_g9241.t1